MNWKEFLTKPVLMVAWGTKEEIETLKKNREFKKIRQNGLLIQK